jgi:hypothetical protein
MDDEAAVPGANPEPDADQRADQQVDPYAHLHKATDPRELRALAHPVRMALYEVLTFHRSLTATQASKLVGGSPTSVAYHLRTLAKYGYVEEAEGGTGRERPWRAKITGFSIEANNADSSMAAAADALSRQLFSRWLARHQAYLEHREQWPEEVRTAAGSSNFVLFGTTEEFEELQNAWGRLVMKYHDRIADPSRRPEGWQMFELQLFTHPLDPGPLALDEEDAGDEESGEG